MAILDNVTFCYVKIKNPVPGLNEGSSEFTVEAVVSKADAKAWDKEHPKNKSKQVDTDEFEEKYKCPPPHPEQENQYLIKFKKIHAKNGVELPSKYRPRVFVPVKGGKPKDITFDTLVQNGSTGKVSYSTFEGPKAFPGTFVQLDAILVEELLEYETEGGDGDSAPIGSDFGADELAPVPENQKVVNKQSDADADDEDEDDEPPAKPTKKVAVAAKPAAKPKKPIVTDDDGEIADSPF